MTKNLDLNSDYITYFYITTKSSQCNLEVYLQTQTKHTS